MKLLVLAAILAVASAGRQQSALRRALFADYDRLVKPDEAIDVDVGINAIGLSYCAHREVLTLNGWVRMIWNDTRLSWDKDEWGGIDRLRIPANELWLPDIALYNSEGKVEANYLFWEDTTKAVILSSGMIFFVPPVTYRSKCISDAAAGDNVMFAEQECKLKLGSWTYDQSELDLNGKEVFGSKPFDFEYFMEKRWEVLDSSVTKAEKEYPCCPGEIYPSLDFNIKFRRVAMMNKEGKLVTAETI